MNKKIASLVLLIAVALFGVSTAFAADTIHFAVVGPMTGDSAGQGIQMKAGAQLAVDEINAKGGINGKKLTFEVADDMATPNQAVIVAQKLSLDKKIMFVLGHNNSSCSIAALPMWEKAGIPVISPSNTNPTLTRLGHKNYFRVVVNDDIMVSQVCKLAVKDLKVKKPALVWENSDYGKGMKDVALKTLPTLGVSLVGEESYVPGVDRDYSAIVTKFKGLGADGVLFLGDYTGAALLAKQAANLNYKAKIVGASSIAHPKLIEIGGKAVEGVVSVTSFDPNDLRTKQAAFIKKYDSINKEKPGEWGAHAYDIVYLIKAAVEAGATDRASLIAKLKGGKSFDGVTGNIKFDQYGDVPDKKAFVITVKNGSFVSYTTK